MRRFTEEFHGGLSGGQGLPNLFGTGKEFRLGDLRYHQSLGGSGNGIVLAAAVDGNEANRQLFQNGRQDLVGVGAALVDLHTAVTAGEVAHRHTADPAGAGLTPNRQRQTAGGAACAANGEDALVLRIAVEQNAALEDAHIHGVGAQHTDLLVHGEHRFQRRML